MRALKIVGFVVLGLALVTGILVALAFAPPVQTWAARRALAGTPGMEIRRVSAGLSGARLQDVRYAKDGVVVIIPEISVRGSALSYARGRRIDVEDFTARDIVIDIQQPATAAPEAKPAPAGAFVALFKLGQLPFDLRVDKLQVTGRALLPDGRTATFEVAGNDIRIGGEGRVGMKVDFADSKPGAALSGAHGDIRTTVHIATDRRIDALAVDATATLEGPRLPPERFQATLKAAQPAAGADETYDLQFGVSRAGGLDRILSAKGSYRNSSDDFSGDWAVALRTEQLASILAGLGLPSVALTGAGKVEFSPLRKAGYATGELTAEVSRLEALNNPALAALKSGRVKGAFDLRMADDLARLERGQFEIFGAEGNRLAEIAVLQKVAVDLRSRKLANFDATSDLARLSIQQLPLAWAQAFAPDSLKIEAGEVSASFTVQATPDGARIRTRAIEPLAIRNLRLRNGDSIIVDGANVSAGPQIEYSGDNLAVEIPDLNVTFPDGDSLAGRVSANVASLRTKPASSFAANLRGRAAGAALKFIPAPTGPLALSLETDGRFEGGILQMSKLDAEVRRDGGAVVVAAKALQPLRINFGAGTYAVENPAEPAAVLQLGELPLAWVQPFVKDSRIAGIASGGSLQVFAESTGAISIRSTAPIAVKGATLALGGKALLNTLDVTTDVALTRRGTSIRFELKSLEAQEAGRPILKAQSSGDLTTGAKWGLTGKGTLEADLAALGRQPVLASLGALSRGNATATFDASTSDGLKLDAKVSVRNLILRDGNRDAGNVETSLAFASKSDGSATLKVPLVLAVGGRRSDVLVEGTVAPGRAGVRNFSGRISGDLIVVDDVMGLAAIGQSGPPQASSSAATRGRGAAVPAAPTAPIVADKVPFWKDFAGKISTDFKQVQSGTNYVVTGVKGNLVVTATKLSIENFEGRYGTDPYTLAGAVTFAPGQARPYSLTARAGVTNLDVGAILRAVNPGAPPAIETRLNIAANLNGTGRTAGELVQAVHGKFDLTGGPGVLRALSKKGQTTAVSAVSTIAQILGAAQGSSASSAIGGVLGVNQGSDTASAIAELTSFFNSAPFDKLTLSAERAEDLSIKITTIEVISAAYRLTGSGTVAHRTDGPVTSQPLSLQLRLAAKDRMAFLFNRAGLLKAEQDDKGYTLLSRDFVVGGTPANPDSSDFWRFILEAALRGAAGMLGK